MKTKRIYIAGPITGVDNYKEAFDNAAAVLTDECHAVMNPAVLPAHPSFTHEQYMEIGYKMLEACDAIYMLRGWRDSKGAVLERDKAISLGMELMYQFDA